jgi:hypothetical protein
MNVPTSFIWIIILFDGDFEYGGGSTLWGYVTKTLNCFVQNSVILCNVICLLAFYLVIVKFDVSVVSWYDNGIILKPQFHFMVYLSKTFWILEISTRQSKNTLGCIGLWIYLYLECITWVKESRPWIQSLNATCWIIRSNFCAFHRSLVSHPSFQDHGSSWAGGGGVVYRQRGLTVIRFEPPSPPPSCNTRSTPLWC